MVSPELKKNSHPDIYTKR